MPIKSGSKGIIGSYFGSTPIIKMYQGSNLVFQKVLTGEISPVVRLLDRSISISLNDLTTEITSIESYAFYNCINLEHINLPPSITLINDYAFDNCISLSNITLPSTVTEIGSYAFRNVKQITVTSETPAKIDKTTFEGAGKIYVPSASLSAYLSHSYWGQFANVIEGV